MNMRKVFDEIRSLLSLPIHNPYLKFLENDSTKTIGHNQLLRLIVQVVAKFRVTHSSDHHALIEQTIEWKHDNYMRVYKDDNKHGQASTGQNYQQEHSQIFVLATYGWLVPCLMYFSTNTDKIRIFS